MTALYSKLDLSNTVFGDAVNLESLEALNTFDIQFLFIYFI
jgi:hypothetical protein